MNVHYDSNAVCKNRKTTMVSSAKKILAEEEGGVDQRYFKGRFVADRYHSMAFFKKVCRNIGNLRNKEIEQMLTVLKNTEQEKLILKMRYISFEEKICMKSYAQILFVRRCVKNSAIPVGKTLLVGFANHIFYQRIRKET